jgi:Holliday junction resolvasome RuvABC endonuclease subunit
MIESFAGIDPSLRRAGLATLQDTNVFADSLRVAEDCRGAERLDKIGAWYEKHLKNVLHPCCVAMEGPSLGSTHREFDLGEASGVIKAVVWRRLQVEPVIVPPTVLKSFTTGNPMADKGAMLHAVKTVWGFETDDDNAADALALAYFARALREVRLVRRCEAEAIHSFLHPKIRRSRAKRDPQNI